MPTEFLDKLHNANVARSKEWDPEKKITPMFFAVELAGEVGEACNIVKKLERERMGIRGSRSSRSELKKELADVLIVLSLLAAEYDIDLVSETILKFNETSDKLNLSVRL